VLPFLTIFLFIVIEFALLSLILGSNHNLATGYEGLSLNQSTLLIAYFLQTFENGIGNISAPTINFLANKKRQSSFDYFILALIYLFWFLAQIVLLIVLLNFVIALISQHYENVMNAKIEHTYSSKQQLNQEYNRVVKFLTKFGFL
jgi:hypothetical protein